MLVIKRLKFLQSCLVFAAMLLVTLSYAQERLVLPGQELLYPNLTDPSFTGEERRTQITVLGQAVDFNTNRSTQYINAQLPIYSNVSFGVDYYKNKFDFYNYSQALLTVAYEIPFDAYNHLKIGVSGGGESLKLNQDPILQQVGVTLPDINESNLEFTYRAGLHFSGNHLIVGGYYTVLPAQTINNLQDADIVNYQFTEGFTGYLGYRMFLSSRFAVTPMFRYLSYLEEPIYEGSVKLQYAGKIDFTLAYRNNYAINPALRVTLFKALGVSYSYEKPIGDLVFKDIHSIGLSYKFKKAQASAEPEWLAVAQENINKTAAIKKPKAKKEKKVVEKTTAEKAIVETDAVAIDKERNKNKAVVETAKPQKAVDTVKAVPTKTITKAVVIEMASRFYIVASSFDDYIAAYQLMEKLKKNGYNALVGSVVDDKKYHVFIDSDFDEATAKKRLAEYKTKSLLKDSYLLGVD